jgi:hypothetical protein
MSVFIFYVAVMLVALTIVGVVGDLIAVLTGYVHPWDYK